MAAVPPAVPAGFRYREAILQQRPSHAAGDRFWLRHHPMDLGQRAKIFAPFDALRGFSEAVSAREVQYEPFRELSEDRRAALDRTLVRLQRRLSGRRKAGAPPVRVELCCFCPCEDPDSEYFGIMGQYRTLRGCLERIDLPRWQLEVDGVRVDMDDIYEIREDGGGSAER